MSRDSGAISSGTVRTRKSLIRLAPSQARMTPLIVEVGGDLQAHCTVRP